MRLVGSFLAFYFAVSLARLSAAPIIIATKDDGIPAGTRKINGDQVVYTITISNTGDATATGLQFADADPAQTTFVSVNSTPIARNDTYSAIGNVQITIPAASGVLANDNDPDDSVNGVGTLSVSASPTTTTNGGNLSVAANGGFTYNPPPGFTGADSFTYTLSDGEGKTDTATVTVNVTNTIWFINASAGTNGDGRLGTPFNSIANYLSSAPSKDAGDTIFLYSGTYSNALPLGASQRLIGQGATSGILAIMGISAPAGSATLPNTGGTRPVISVSGGTALALSSGNNVQGLNITNANGDAVSGSAVGTLTLADFNATSTNGFALSLVTSGTVTATGTNSLTSASGTALNVVNTSIGGGGLNFVSISTNGGSKTAINLNNSGSGPLTVNGTGTAASGGTIQNLVGVDAVRLNLTNGLVTLKYMVIQDITDSSDAGAANETHSNVDAIHGTAINAGLTLDSTTIRRISDSGINGSVDGATVTATVWNGLTLTNCLFEDISRFNVANHADSTNEGAVFMIGLKGVVAVNGCTFQRASNGLFLQTDTSGTLDMTVRSNSFLQLYKEIGTSSVGNYGLDVRQEGSLSSVIRIGDTASESSSGLGNIFTNGGDRASIRIIADTGATAPLKVSVAKNTFTVTDHSSPGVSAGSTSYNFPQGGVLYRSLGTGNFEGIFAANMLDQVMHADGGLGQFSMLSEGGATEVIVRNNTFKLPWDAPVELRASNTSGVQTAAQVLFQNNTYIDGSVGDGTTDLGGPSPYEGFYVNVINGGKMDLTVQNETMGLTDSSSAIAQSFYVNVGNASNTLNLFLQNVQSPRGFRLGQNAPAVFNLYKNGSGSATVVGVLQDNGNRGGGGVDGTNPPTVTQLGTINLSTTAPMLPSISAPLLFAPSSTASSGLATPENAAEAIAWTERVRAQAESAPSAANALTQSQLDAIVAKARLLWEEAGLTEAQRSALATVQFEVADLPGWKLGEASDLMIRVDRDAGGNGWSVEGEQPTAPAQIDLLTAILHEMGHVLGLNDCYHESDRTNLMYGFLTKGERRLPAKDQASGLTPHMDGATHFLSTPLAIGDLPAGKTVTITYTVTINANTTAISISNQGTVSGGNIASKLTDDPTVGGTADATVTPVNQPPVVSNVSVSTNEDATLNFTAANFTGGYSDPNGDALSSITITSLPANGTLKVGASNAAINQVVTAANLSTISFVPAGDFNGATSFGWKASDGSLTSAASALVNITVVAVNDAPVLANLEAAALSYTENAAPTPISATLTVSDIDSANLAGATVQITGNYVNGQDLLAVATQNGISGTFTAATGLLTLSGSSSVANYQAALRSVTYANSSDNPSTLPRTLSIKVDDGGSPNNLSNTVTRNITVTAVNDLPVITGQNVVTVAEDTSRAITTADLLVSDPDNSYPTGFTVSVGTGSNYTVAGALITPAANYNGPLAVPVTVNDGSGGTSLSFNLAVTVTPVNDNPTAVTDTITRYPTQSVKVAETLLLANDTDLDGDTPLSITGVTPSANGATVTRSGGYVYYTPAAGFTAADTFTYTLSDGHGGTASGTVNVNVITDPGNNGLNVVRIASEPAAGGGTQTRVTFAGIPGRTYRVQSSDSLSPATWVDKGSFPANAQGVFEYVDPPPLPGTRYYRSLQP